MAVSCDIGNTSLRNDMAAPGAGIRPHFDEPVRLRENLRLVIDQYHGISVGDQITHHAGQPDDVGRMQPDRRFIQHIQDARGTVADGTGQLHPLPFTGGKRLGSPVQRQIAQPQIQQPPCRFGKRIDDAFRHRNHLFRQQAGHTRHPFRQTGKRHLAGFIQRNATQFRRSCRIRKTGSVTVGANVFFQEFFHPFHALLVPDFRQGVFNGINRVEIGEVEFSGLIGTFGLVQDAPFFRRSVIDDVFFLFGEFAKPNVCAHAHFAADIRHQRPHQGIPGRDRSLIDGKGFIRHKSRPIDCPYCSRSIAGTAGALAVEGQLFGGRGVKPGTTFRADKFLPRRNGQRGFQIMSIGAPVARQP